MLIPTAQRHAHAEGSAFQLSTHLLEDLHQNEVELVDECRFAAVQLLVGAVLDDQVGDVIFDPLALLCWQCCPSELDDTLQNLWADSRVRQACRDRMRPRGTA